MAIPVDDIILAAIVVPIAIYAIVFLCTWNAYADWYNTVIAPKVWDDKQERIRSVLTDPTLLWQLAFVQLHPKMPLSIRLGIIIVRCFAALFAMCALALIVMTLLVNLPA